jgi:hypothetical protein
VRGGSAGPGEPEDAHVGEQLVAADGVLGQIRGGVGPFPGNWRPLEKDLLHSRHLARGLQVWHAALSLLNAGAAPAQIAQRAGHSTTVLLAVYTHCTDGQDDVTNGRSTEPFTPATRHVAGQQAVRRTAGTTPILSAICP